MKGSALTLLALLLLAILVQSCASRRGCSTRGHTRTEMGWM
jgi:hypothetical protein